MYILVWPDIEDVAISMVIPIVLFALNKFLSGMGSGDIELMVALAFCFKLIELVKVVFISSFLNLVYAFFKKKDSYSFVPFLSISCLIIYLFG